MVFLFCQLSVARFQATCTQECTYVEGERKHNYKYLLRILTQIVLIATEMVNKQGNTNLMIVT